MLIGGISRLEKCAGAHHVSRSCPAVIKTFDPMQEKHAYIFRHDRRCQPRAMQHEEEEDKAGKGSWGFGRDDVEKTSAHSSAPFAFRLLWPAMGIPDKCERRGA